MTWYQRVGCVLLLGVCSLLMMSCPGDNTNEGDDVTPPATDPNVTELGLRLLPEGVDLRGLSAQEMAQITRGSYLVNGAAGCGGCHTAAAGYLAGGFEFQLFPDIQGFTSVFSRNLTPDPDTGLHLNEDEFIEAMRTGKDFEDDTAMNPQRMIIMPWHVYRFMSGADLRAIYAYLQRIPPIRHEVRETFIPPFPFPPVPFPALGDGDPVQDPDNVEHGLRIPQFFSTGPDAAAFVAQFNAAVENVSAEERARVGRGSYLVNALGDCSNCHTDGSGDGMFDGGLLPGTVDVNTAAYLAGGVNIGLLLGFDLFSRNLTPDPTTGLFLTEEQFLEAVRFGADFRRPNGSLRIVPHFPVEFRLTIDDFKAIYAYLQVIPAVENAVNIIP